ncbi:MAG: carbohydrate kinase family protein, partial [Acidimicrobiales bacterium]
MPPVLVVLGDVMADVVARLRAPLSAGGDTPASITVRPGGSAASLAVAAAAAGAEAHLFASVGDDSAGKGAAVALRSAGVRIHLTRCERPTGTVVALVNEDGTRTMASDRGANRDVAVPDLFVPGAHLHVSGYVLIDDGTRPVGLAALHRAAAAGMSRSVDASPGVGEWLPEADWCCLNLEEGRALTGRDDPEHVATALLERFDAVALTLGASGAVVAQRGRSLLRRPAPPACLVDSTGAGDAFAGTW